MCYFSFSKFPTIPPLVHRSTFSFSKSPISIVSFSSFRASLFHSPIHHCFILPFSTFPFWVFVPQLLLFHSPFCHDSSLACFVESLRWFFCLVYVFIVGSIELLFTSIVKHFYHFLISHLFVASFPHSPIFQFSHFAFSHFPIFSFSHVPIF